MFQISLCVKSHCRFIKYELLIIMFVLYLYLVFFLTRNVISILRKSLWKRRKNVRIWHFCFLWNNNSYHNNTVLKISSWNKLSYSIVVYFIPKVQKWSFFIRAQVLTSKAKREDWRRLNWQLNNTCCHDANNIKKPNNLELIIEREMQSAEILFFTLHFSPIL